MEKDRAGELNLLLEHTSSNRFSLNDTDLRIVGLGTTGRRYENRVSAVSLSFAHDGESPSKEFELRPDFKIGRNSEWQHLVFGEETLL